MPERDATDSAFSNRRITVTDIITDLRAIRQLEGVLDGLDIAANARSGQAGSALSGVWPWSSRRAG
ncbi:hypothetical protein [Roseinatronobacter sp. NSM]|uniref:hypothetical protein n=1 Tax=Roseinatronobacter sp. NSM TaxID=3457785 RepID=UPI004037405E